MALIKNIRMLHLHHTAYFRYKFHQTLNQLFTVEVIIDLFETSRDFQNIFHWENVQLCIIVKEDMQNMVNQPTKFINTIYYVIKLPNQQVMRTEIHDVFLWLAHVFNKVHITVVIDSLNR